jgi:uncharacterized membrane protein
MSHDVFSVQRAFWGAIISNTSGLQVFLVAQIFVFLSFTFVPGILILKFLNSITLVIETPAVFID